MAFPELLVDKVFTAIPHKSSDAEKWTRLIVNFNYRGGRKDAEEFCAAIRSAGHKCCRILEFEDLSMAVKSWPAGGLTPPELDPKDPSYARLAIAKARSVVRKIEKAEVAKLALLIHPGKGLRISPITHISLEEDVVVNRYNLLDRNFLRRKLIPGSGYEFPAPPCRLFDLRNYLKDYAYERAYAATRQRRPGVPRRCLSVRHRLRTVGLGRAVRRGRGARIRARQPPMRDRLKLQQGTTLEACNINAVVFVPNKLIVRPTIMTPGENQGATIR
ncbi:MAG: hypothetical protein ACR2PG_02185 [Hyphomicrobiaceae bacterium]